ncbi:MAG: hypothetical protein AAGJ10_01485 [Bacteroidota bacterium]
MLGTDIGVVLEHSYASGTYSQSSSVAASRIRAAVDAYRLRATVTLYDRWVVESRLLAGQSSSFSLANLKSQSFPREVSHQIFAVGAGMRFSALTRAEAMHPYYGKAAKLLVSYKTFAQTVEGRQTRQHAVEIGLEAITRPILKRFTYEGGLYATPFARMESPDGAHLAQQSRFAWGYYAGLGIELHQFATLVLGIQSRDQLAYTLDEDRVSAAYPSYMITLKSML